MPDRPDVEYNYDHHSYEFGHQKGYDCSRLLGGLSDESVSNAAATAYGATRSKLTLDSDNFQEGYIEGYFHSEEDKKYNQDSTD